MEHSTLIHHIESIWQIDVPCTLFIFLRVVGRNFIASTPRIKYTEVVLCSKLMVHANVKYDVVFSIYEEYNFLKLSHFMSLHRIFVIWHLNFTIPYQF